MFGKIQESGQWQWGTGSTGVSEGKHKAPFTHALMGSGTFPTDEPAVF